MALTIGGVTLAVGGLAAVTGISCLVVDKCVMRVGRCAQREPSSAFGMQSRFGRLQDGTACSPGAPGIVFSLVQQLRRVYSK